MEVEAVDGQAQGQEGVPPEVEDTADPAPADPYASRFEDLDSKYGMLSDGVNEIRNLVSQLAATSQTQQVAAEAEDDFDDDEPVTSSKIRKIVSGAINTAVSRNEASNSRKSWDEKAKEEFPVADPKFNHELQKTWNELTGAGLDPKSPKAVYMAAKVTAQRLGTAAKGKTTSRKVTEETVHTSEAPTTGGQSATASGKKVSMVPEDDTRVRFYAMKRNKTKDQIEAFRKTLAAKDARKAKRR